MAGSSMTFVPWLRAGISATIASGARNRPDASVTFAVTKTPDSGAATSTPMSFSLSMMGPGDVLGIVPDEIAHVFPSDGASGVDTTVFPAVTFRHPELPWLFSPAVEMPGTHQLTPWCCLVTVRVQDGVVVDQSSGILTIEDPAVPSHELPDLAEVYAWAHVQYAAGSLEGETPVSAAAPLSDGTATTSRLLSPRFLTPDTSYVCAVVPTFAAGVTAGLGGTPDPAAAPAPAWDTTSSSITLPVYFCFQFTTGAGGDFKSLAQLLLHPEAVTAAPGSGLGQRSLALPGPASAAGSPAPGGTAVAPPAPGGTTPLPAMLLPASASPPAAPAADVTTWMQAEITPTATAGGLPQLRLPLYGAVQAGIKPADLTTGFAGLPQWWQRLNTDPGLRVLGAIGSAVVSSDQEEILAEAWRQVGDTTAVNATLNRAQAARLAVDRQVTRHLTPQSDPVALLQLLGPQSERVQLTVTAQTSTLVGTPTQLAQSSGDPAMPATLSSAYRRLTRSGTAASAELPPSLSPSLSFGTSTLLSKFAASTTVPTRVVSEWLSPAAQQAAVARPDPLRPLAPAVNITTAMVGPLTQLAPDAVLPGAANIPPNTAVVLQTDPEAIAAYMVGVNNAAGQLFNWRGVPSDRRATYFRQFWGSSAAPDLTAPIAAWLSTDGLDSHVAPAELVLGVRADLLRRYPNTAVYAVAAASAGAPEDMTDAQNLIQPVFSATLPPDLQIYGFNVTVTPGGPLPYFFVFQEQFSEARFGSDQLSVPQSPSTTAPGYWTVAQVAPAVDDAAAVAVRAWMPPVVVALGAASLMVQA